MKPELIRALNAERRARRAAIVVTDLASGDSRLVRRAGADEDALGDLLEGRFRSGRSGIAEAAGRSYFLNVHLPAPRMVIIGAVHISQALAPMAGIAGFDVKVVDPRTAFATPERFAGVALQAEWPQDVFAAQPLDPFTALVAVTHDPKIDDPALTAGLEAGCFYVGALGSRKTHGSRLERLKRSGLGDLAIERIAAPIGLAIGAASPAEIAVSILAQVVQALRLSPGRVEQ